MKIEKSFFEILANGESLEEKHKDHALVDNKYFKNCRECHITPDWLLVYKYIENELVLFLVQNGSHNEVLKLHFFKIK